jgi:hypothetical protein
MVVGSVFLAGEAADYDNERTGKSRSQSQHCEAIVALTDERKEESEVERSSVRGC